jgi:hypothetical protein
MNGLTPDFSHGLQEFRSKIWPLILQGFLSAYVRCENIPPFTARVFLVTDETKRRYPA